MTTTLAEDAAALGELKSSAGKAQAKADELKAQAAEAELRLFARMDEEGVDSLKVRGTNFVPAATSYGQIQDRDEFIAWAKENDVSLIELKERKGLLNELVREKLDNGEELPPGVGFYVREYVSLRAA